MALRDKYAWAMKVATDLKFHGSTHEENGKFIMNGTVGSEDEKRRIWDAIKTIPEWNGEVQADIRVDPAMGGATSATQQTYTVKPGDTLGKIAKEFLGSANAYPRIFEANRDQLSDPDRIKPGQVLKIPAVSK